MNAIAKIVNNLGLSLSLFRWRILLFFAVFPVFISSVAYVLGSSFFIAIGWGLLTSLLCLLAAVIGVKVGSNWIFNQLEPIIRGYHEDFQELGQALYELGNAIEDNSFEVESFQNELDEEAIELDSTDIYGRRIGLLEKNLTELNSYVVRLTDKYESLILKQGRMGMTEERSQRALIFKSIKDANPSLSYAAVSMRANRDYGEKVGITTEHDVRNDYKAMGWKWERGNRLR